LYRWYYPCRYIPRLFRWKAFKFGLCHLFSQKLFRQFRVFYFKKCQLGSFMFRRKTDAIQSLQSPFSLARMAQIGLIFTFRPFSRKTFQTVLRFSFQNISIGVLDVVYKDRCHWIALKPRFSGPKDPNRPWFSLFDHFLKNYLDTFEIFYFRTF